MHIVGVLKLRIYAANLIMGKVLYSWGFSSKTREARRNRASLVLFTTIYLTCFDYLLVSGLHTLVDCGAD